MDNASGKTKQVCAEQDWRAAMADLALAAATAQSTETGRLLRELRALLQQAPPAWAWLAQDLPSVAEIDAAIVADAAVGGAIALAQGRAGYILSQGIGGPAMASTVIEGCDDECHGEGPTAALALIGALAAAFAGAALDLRRTAGAKAAPIGALLN